MQARAAGDLAFFGDLATLNVEDDFTAMVAAQVRASWVVYAKPPFGSPQYVLAYLGRYTHRVAIANSRLVSMDDARVCFRWRDYRHSNAARVMTCQQAWNIGSDSILMQVGACLVLFSRRNQHDGSATSFFSACPEGVCG